MPRTKEQVQKDLVLAESNRRDHLAAVAANEEALRQAEATEEKYNRQRDESEEDNAFEVELENVGRAREVYDQHLKAAQERVSYEEANIEALKSELDAVAEAEEAQKQADQEAEPDPPQPAPETTPIPKAGRDLGVGDPPLTPAGNPDLSGHPKNDPLGRVGGGEGVPSLSPRADDPHPSEPYNAHNIEAPDQANEVEPRHDEERPDEPQDSRDITAAETERLDERKEYASEPDGAHLPEAVDEGADTAHSQQQRQSDSGTDHGDVVESRPADVVLEASAQDVPDADEASEAAADELQAEREENAEEKDLDELTDPEA